MDWSATAHELPRATASMQSIQACPGSWLSAMQEEYLSAAAFEKVFGMSKEAFAALPAWKRLDAKKKHGLF